MNWTNMSNRRRLLAAVALAVLFAGATVYVLYGFVMVQSGHYVPGA